jgi:hypothetical protein
MAIQFTKWPYDLPNNHKVHIPNGPKYTKWLQNIPNGSKMCQHLPLQDPPKFIQVGIFGLKINHLAPCRKLGPLKNLLCIDFPLAQKNPDEEKKSLFLDRHCSDPTY